MHFDEYQKATARIIPIIPDLDILYPVLGIGGESGELQEKYKKLFRDKKGKITKKFIKDVKGELGDILWYISDCARTLGLSLEEVARCNIRKNNRRQRNGTVKGNGDSR
jgi:NTP pyrophosphatase (non-canonical NTP hydrolase)